MSIVVKDKGEVVRELLRMLTFIARNDLTRNVYKPRETHA